MGDAFTLTNIAMACIWGLITGPVSNRADAAVLSSARRLTQILANTQTPANHDVLRATHAAWLQSIRIMAKLADGAGSSWDDLRSHENLMKAVRSRVLTDFSFDGANFPHAELDRVVGEIYRENADPQAVATEATIAHVEAAMGAPLTDSLRAVFREGHATKRGWAATFQLLFSQQVKENAAVFRILTFERLNEVIAFADAHSTALAELNRDFQQYRIEMHGRFDVVEAKQDEEIVILRQILGRQSAAADSAPGRTALKDLLSPLEAFRDSWARLSVQVGCIGREAELDQLAEFAQGGDAKFSWQVLRGGHAVGKSRLGYEWLKALPAGWTTGFLPIETLRLIARDGVKHEGEDVAVVIDNAGSESETLWTALHMLLNAQRGGRIRIILIAHQELEPPPFPFERQQEIQMARQQRRQDVDGGEIVVAVESIILRPIPDSAARMKLIDAAAQMAGKSWSEDQATRFCDETGGRPAFLALAGAYGPDWKRQIADYAHSLIGRAKASFRIAATNR